MVLDLAIISLGVAVTVGGIQLLSYINTHSRHKEATMDRYAKTDGIDTELTVIRKDITDVEVRMEDHTSKISTLQSQSAVLISQMTFQIRELEKLSDKLDGLK